MIPCLYFEDALSIKKAVANGDIVAASEILRQVLANKPKENKWALGAEKRKPLQGPFTKLVVDEQRARISLRHF